MNRPRIFVHIPSYRDRECQWTLRDLFERALHPERVFVGVCWQTVPEEDGDCFAVRPRPGQVRTKSFHIREARGLGWARAQAQSLWEGEEFSLQIDSHMRFVDGWDERLLDMLGACDGADPVLTHYPAGYDPPDTRNAMDRPHVQMVRAFLPNGLLDYTASVVPPDVVIDRPMPTAGLGGGFVFGSSRILVDVPSDPEIYFNGEEPNLAVRLWTAGFDLFSPHETLLYHYYLRKDGARHWNDALPRQTMELQERTLRRMRLLCEPEAFTPDEVATLGRYGLGRRRSLADYEAYAGVDFSARTIAVEARSYPWVRPADVRERFALSNALRPAIGSHLFILGSEGVLFTEGKGSMHRFNEAATLIWCALEAGQDWQQIAVDGAEGRSVPVATVLAELRELASHWIAEGLLEDRRRRSEVGPRLDGPHFAFRSRDYRLLDTVVRLRFGDDATGLLVHSAFSHLSLDDDSTTPTVVLTAVKILEWDYLFAGDQLLYSGESGRGLIPRLKAEMMAQAIKRCPHIAHLHAAAVMWAGKLILLPGRSGSGKSLLTARLLALGSEYFGDDAVLLRPSDGAVRPIPIALSIKDEGVEHLSDFFPELPGSAKHDREDGLSVRYLPPPPTSMPPQGRVARIDVIVFPRHEAGAKTSLRTVSAADALSRLLAECLAIPQKLTLQAASTLVETVERAACWELISSDLGDAVASILALVDTGSLSSTTPIPPPSTVRESPASRASTRPA